MPAFSRTVGNRTILVINVLSILIGIYGFSQISSKPLPSHLRGAGQWQFLTNLSLVYSIFVFLLGFIAHLTHSERLFAIKNGVHAIGFILEIVVFEVYWPLRLFFIHHLVKNPAEFSLPIAVDLSIHLMPVVSLGIDFFLFMPVWTISTRWAFSVCMFLTMAYWAWLHHLIDFEKGGLFPYEFFNVDNNIIRTSIFVLVGSIGFLHFILMKKLYHVLIKSTIHEIKEEKKNT